MVNVKVCGILRIEDIGYINKFKPDYIGFVFAHSSRQVNDSVAMELKRELNPTIKSVGVFVNDDIKRVARLCNTGVIDMIQLHGDEGEDYIVELKSQTSAPIIKAVRVRNECDIICVEGLSCDYLLLDTYKEDQYGGSNAIGIFYEFIKEPSVRLIGCEAAGLGVDTNKTAATVTTGFLGIFHGMKSYFCQDEYGQIAPVYSISAGLDYPGVGPEHSHLHDIKRAEYVPVTDKEAVDAFGYLSRIEGIIPAIESAHAVAYARKLAPTMGKDEIMVINLSGRGDKDVAAIAKYQGVNISE